MNTGDIIKLNRDWYIDKKFASGGFGEIYFGKSEANEIVAIKLMPKMPGASREMLFEELNGVPNVVPVIDKGEWQDYWVIIMPKADKSLREYLIEHEGKLGVDETVEILLNITTALAVIKGRIVHRDLKPENILLLEGQWCLADFGIARYAEASTSPDTKKFTMTPPYAAPEQWRGERATVKTDIYAMGIIAYEMLSGERPFKGPEIHELRKQHLEQVPPQVTNSPVRLQGLIAECLYKAAEARPSPENIIERLNMNRKPASEAALRLQKANLVEIERIAEITRKLSVEENELRRKSELFVAAKNGLEMISTMLHEQIVEASPKSVNREGKLWPCMLASASIEISPINQELISKTNIKYEAPFVIIAYSEIIVRIPRGRYDYEGRSHSLWYCDAQEKDVFRWYETAFMITPGMPKRGLINPFALKPHEKAFGALSPVMTEYRVAWPFTAIDQGNEGEFIERWMGWFATAVEGRLRNPSHMPERKANGSWRSR